MKSAPNGLISKLCLPAKRSRKKIPIRTVQELLGSKDLKTTMIYTHSINKGALSTPHLECRHASHSTFYMWGSQQSDQKKLANVEVGYYTDEHQLLVSEVKHDSKIFFH